MEDTRQGNLHVRQRPAPTNLIPAALLLATMGDKVERALEETVPLLRQVRRLKLLSEPEIANLVQRRRDHEYALLRPSASRAEFMRYAAMERETAELFHERARAKQLPEKRALSIASQQASRVNLVYSRAIRKFKGDDLLYLHYARHCVKTGSRKSAEKVLARAIAHRGDSEKVWLAAVAFHFDSCGDIKVARALSQRALRALKNSKLLWKEYFRLELAYLAKLVARRTTVGMAPAEVDAEQAGAGVGSNEGEELGNSSPFRSHSESEDPLENHGKVDATSKEIAVKLDFWKGGVPFAVFKAALTTAKLDAFDAAGYLQLASSTKFAPIALLTAIRDVLRKDFDAESSPVLHAQLLLLPFVIACSRLFSRRAADEASSDVGADEELPTLKNSEITTELLNSATREAEIALTQLHLLAPSIRDSDGERGSLIPILSQFGQALNEHLGSQVSGKLVSQLESVERLICSSGDGNGGPGTSSSPLTLEDVKEAQLAARWASYLQSAEVVTFLESNDASSLGAIRSALKETAAAVPFRSAEQERICLQWFQWERDVTQLRHACSAVLSVPPVTMKLLRGAIEAEVRFVSGQPSDDTLANARKLFAKAAVLGDAAVDIDFWLYYLRFERDIARNASLAAAVQWKAGNTLAKKCQSGFQEQCILINML